MRERISLALIGAGVIGSLAAAAADQLVLVVLAVFATFAGWQIGDPR
jgi:hypothetical protein